jgi:hypothetical protein
MFWQIPENRPISRRSIAYDGTLAKLKGTLEAAGIRFHFDGATKGICADTITDTALKLDN